MKKLCAIASAALLLMPLAGRAADLTISAAASLTNAFAELAKAYERANPGAHVLLNFGSSGSLLQQISRGAPVDVFASADLETMDRAEKQHLIAVDSVSKFAANKLVVVLPSDSALSVRTLADLASPKFARLAIGIPSSVPAGRYAKQALERAGEWDALTDKYIYGQNVRQVLDYVARGEVDAGFVYASDAALMKDRVKVALEADVGTPIVYPIAVVKGSGNENGARRFIEFVNSDESQQALAKYGFARP